MIYVPDTNVILAVIQSAHLHHAVAQQVIAKIVQKNGVINLLPQTLYEFWNVCTRPEKYNGLGKTPDEVEQIVRDLESTFAILYDTRAVYEEWRHLVRLHNVSGVQVHDARIAAAVRIHNVSFLVTFNTEDFKRFGIATIHPTDM